MRTYKALETGSEYTLAQLFAEDNFIVMPDLQRDYCWGNKTDKIDLVGNFVDNLKELYKFGDNNKHQMGIIYGYTQPEGHVQLCDGQQRITTLFLLVGMLYRALKDKSSLGLNRILISDIELGLRRILISDIELNDDFEPHLQYAIRESTLYFLSDLVRYFFVDKNQNNIPLAKIKQQPWYFKDYDIDPSIQSMLTALKSIEDKIAKLDDKLSFAYFITNKISFLYYDMENRANGEETFVVINTTGEPLSATENLKPLLLSKISDENTRKESSKKWEEIEQWFWENRGDNDTSDNGILELFRWVTLLQYNEDILPKERVETILSNRYFRKIEFDVLYSYFTAAKKLFDGCIFEKGLLSPKNLGNDKGVWFRLLPVLEYVRKYAYVADDLNLIRIKTWFSHLSKIGRISNNYDTSLKEALKIAEAIRSTPNGEQFDIAKYVISNDHISKTLRSDEEIYKFNLYRNSHIREQYEDAFWKSEKHRVWSGEIMPLLKWSEIDGHFDLNRFKEMSEAFNSLIHNRDGELSSDLTRRALLTIGLENYPRIFKGYTNYSFCYEPSDWRTLINENIDLFGKFVANFINVDENEKDKLRQKMIDDFSEINHDFYAFVKYDDILKYCERKFIQYNYGEWWLIKQIRATTYKLLEVFKKFVVEGKMDIPFDKFDGERVYFEGFTVHYYPDKKVYKLQTESEEFKSTHHDLNWEYKDDDRCWYSLDIPSNEIVCKVKEISQI